MSINLKVKSIGWSLLDSVGGTPGEILSVSPENQAEKSAIFCKPFKNFGRLDNMSKAVCTAIAFALKGADFYPVPEKLPIAIFFSNKNGSLKSDKTYFKDFVEFGETAGRANLFLYTLPTSPLGEASVHFGLTGEIAYFADLDNSLKTMLEAANDACEFRKSGDIEKQFLIGLGSNNHSSNNLRSENANYLKEPAEAIFLLVSNGNQKIEISDVILNQLPDFKQLHQLIKGNIT